MMSTEPKEGDLRVWWIPQIPMKPFCVDVDSLAEGRKLRTVLADYDLFQYEHNIKSDYSNVGGTHRYEDGDGSGNLDWFDVEEDE